MYEQESIRGQFFYTYSMRYWEKLLKLPCAWGNADVWHLWMFHLHYLTTFSCKLLISSKIISTLIFSYISELVFISCKDFVFYISPASNLNVSFTPCFRVNIVFNQYLIQFKKHFCTFTYLNFQWIFSGFVFIVHIKTLFSVSQII
jgi:hypothetical protein